MIILINTKTNERQVLTMHQLFDLMGDPDTLKCMGEGPSATIDGKPADALVYTYTPSD